MKTIKGRFKSQAKSRLKSHAVVVPSLVQMRSRAAAGKKIKPRDLGRFLLAITTYAELGVKVPAHFLDGQLVSIPIDVAKFIGKELIGPLEWSASQNKVRAAAAKPRMERLKQAADEYRRCYPKLGNERIAEKIMADPAMREAITVRRGGKPHQMSAGYLRKLIAKK